MQNFNIGGFEEMILFRLKFPDWGVSTLRVIQIHTIQIEGYLVQPIGVPDFLNLDVVTETKSRILSIKKNVFDIITLYACEEKAAQNIQKCDIIFLCQPPHLFISFPAPFYRCMWYGLVPLLALAPFSLQEWQAKDPKSFWIPRSNSLPSGCHFQWTFA